MKVSFEKKDIVRFADLDSGECFTTESGGALIKAFKDSPEFREREFFGVSLESGYVVRFDDDTEVKRIELECKEV